MAAARSEAPILLQALAKDGNRTVIVKFCHLLSSVGRSGLQCDLDRVYINGSRN